MREVENKHLRYVRSLEVDESHPLYDSLIVESIFCRSFARYKTKGYGYRRYTALRSYCKGELADFVKRYEPEFVITESELYKDAIDDGITDLNNLRIIISRIDALTLDGIDKLDGKNRELLDTLVTHATDTMIVLFDKNGYNWKNIQWLEYNTPDRISVNFEDEERINKYHVTIASPSFKISSEMPVR